MEVRNGADTQDKGVSVPPTRTRHEKRKVSKRPRLCWPRLAQRSKAHALGQEHCRAEGWVGERHGKWRLQAVTLASTSAFTTPVPPHVPMPRVHTDFTILFALIIHVVLQTLILRVTLL